MSDPTRLLAAHDLAAAVDRLLQAVAAYKYLPYLPPHRDPAREDYDELARLHAVVVGLAAAAGLEGPPPLEDAGLAYCEVVAGWGTKAMVYGPNQYPGSREADPEAWARQLRHLRGAAETLAAAQAAAAPQVQQKRRRRLPPRAITPLTPEQTEAMQLVGEHKGDLSAAARAAGKSRQAMAKLYQKALRKLGVKASAKPKTQRLPHDRRGQAMVEDTAPAEDDA
jgi:predicted DNA-binding protein (UPF0251 family)